MISVEHQRVYRLHAEGPYDRHFPAALSGSGNLGGAAEKEGAE